jgi:hypothetical protein
MLNSKRLIELAHFMGGDKATGPMLQVDKWDGGSAGWRAFVVRLASGWWPADRFVAIGGRLAENCQWAVDNLIGMLSCSRLAADPVAAGGWHLSAGQIVWGRLHQQQDGRRADDGTGVTRSTRTCWPLSTNGIDIRVEPSATDRRLPINSSVDSRSAGRAVGRRTGARMPLFPSDPINMFISDGCCFIMLMAVSKQVASLAV